MKEAGADAVKLEGAGPSSRASHAIVGAGIPVMGHIGLTPQSATMLGGFKAQGRSAAQARQLFEDALALEAAGCFSLVLEAVPAPVAERITGALSIPTIGIGAGAACDGQVLVYHDLLGLYEGNSPRFVKRYADIGGEIRRALEAYAADVREGRSRRSSTRTRCRRRSSRCSRRRWRRSLAELRFAQAFPVAISGPSRGRRRRRRSA